MTDPASIEASTDGFDTGTLPDRVDLARFDAARSEAAALEGTLLDVAIVDLLAEELDGHDVVWRIARLYRDALPQRGHRLSRACHEMDAETAMDAALCLKVTSATIGASAMSGVAALVERAVVALDWSSALGAMSVVAELLTVTDEAIHTLQAVRTRELA